MGPTILSLVERLSIYTSIIKYNILAKVSFVEGPSLHLRGSVIGGFTVVGIYVQDSLLVEPLLFLRHEGLDANSSNDVGQSQVEDGGGSGRGVWDGGRQDLVREHGHQVKGEPHWVLHVVEDYGLEVCHSLAVAVLVGEVELEEHLHNG